MQCALATLAVTVWPARQLGSEFMPDLNEGTLLYMPTTLPGISVTKAAELLQVQDRIIKSFPEVDSVYGKAGRAATATDPAPTEMFETVINLKPEEQWRPGVTTGSLKAEFALVGGIWLMWWLGFNMSVAVAVGFIALAGVAAETGVVMLIYLDQAVAELKATRAMEGPFSNSDLHEAVMVGAVERVRPKMMTVVTIMAGLVPILWSTGTGSEVMQRIAVPMIGGMISSTVLTLVMIPAIYGIIKGWGLHAKVEQPVDEKVERATLPDAAGRV